MRICLFWNPTAGGGNSLADLTRHITSAGHEVVRVADRTVDLREHLTPDIECVAAAGGDGTIARAGRALAGGRVPLAILPLGTANNIATSLSLEGSLDDVIARWSRDRIVHIDVGEMESAGSRAHFLESVGCGLVTMCIEEARRTLSKDDPETHLEDARRLYVDLLARLEPRRYSLLIGGEEVTGEFVLVEALNTPRIGPSVHLSPDASVADGLLSVVAVAESERDKLAAYLDALLHGSQAAAGFASWRAPEIEIRGADRVHIDDRVEPAGDVVRVRVTPRTLPVLA